ncbi:MAG: DNA polymerase III subunit beta [FCB group bacterium]|nr:DNA polymerase III subunit beta [FCB group bacterium]
MKITFNRLAFLDQWTRAASVAPQRHQQPVLNNVKLDTTCAGGDSVLLTANSIDVGVAIEADGVEIAEDGVVLLPVQKFTSVLKEFTAMMLTVSSPSDGGKLTVTGGSAKITLQCQPPEEFPDVPLFNDIASIDISPELLRAIVDRTAFAAADDSSRYALGGVLLETDGNSLIGVATDGRRASKMQGTAEMIGDDVLGPEFTVVPTTAIQLAARLFSDLGANESLVIRPMKNSVIFDAAGRTFYARLLEGRFPDWRQAFSGHKGADKIKVAAGPFYSAIRQAAIVSDSDTSAMNLVFSANKLDITTVAAEIGGAAVSLPVNGGIGESIIKINHHYLSDVLRKLQPETEVVIQIDKGAFLLSTDDGLEYMAMGMESTGD